MERTKTCRYCQKEFTAKRIDAKYCSDSCRQMNHRRESDPWTYGKVVPIYFELEEIEYHTLLKKANEVRKHPNEFAKELLIKSHEGLVKLFFSSQEMSTLINPLSSIRRKSASKLIRDWTLERAKEEMKDYS
jgi:hypothetical protein